MKNDVKISIIIPVYNSEKFLNKCFDSIICQSYKKFEVIVINDGSKDNSLDICKKYEKIDNRFKVYSQKNHGIAYTRNYGISLARGEYLMFIDNDDWIEKDYLKKYIDEIDDVDLVCGGFCRRNYDNVLYEKTLLNDMDVYKYLAPWAKIYKRDIIKKNNIKFLDYKLGEDVYFNILYLDAITQYKIIQYNGYNWFDNFNSFSNSVQKGKIISPIYLLDSIYNNIKRKDDFEYFFIMYIVWYLRFIPYDKFKFFDIYNKCINWLMDKYPNYKKNKYFDIFKKYNDFSVSLFTKLLFLFQTIKLDKIYMILFKKIVK